MCTTTYSYIPYICLSTFAPERILFVHYSFVSSFHLDVLLSSNVALLELDFTPATSSSVFFAIRDIAHTTGRAWEERERENKGEQQFLVPDIIGESSTTERLMGTFAVMLLVASC